MSVAPKPIDVHVGARLRLRRQLLGLSQTTLGDAVGVTFQQIQKYERGFNRMGASRLAELAQALGVAPAYFFEGFSGLEGPAAGAETLSEAAVIAFLGSRDGVALASAWVRLSDPEVRTRLLSLIEALAQESEPAGAQTAEERRTAPRKRPARSRTSRFNTSTSRVAQVS